MTHIYHPLDVTVNRSAKAHTRPKTHQRVTDEVQKQILDGIKPEEINQKDL